MSPARSSMALAALVLSASLAGCDADHGASLADQVSQQALVANNCRVWAAQSSQKGCRPLDGVTVAIER